MKLILVIAKEVIGKYKRGVCYLFKRITVNSRILVLKVIAYLYVFEWYDEKAILSRERNILKMSLSYYIGPRSLNLFYNSS